MEKDLVICHTPFQVELILSLVNETVIKNFDFIMISEVDTKQVDYYFNMVSKIADVCEKKILSNNARKNVFGLSNELKAKFNYYQYNRTFVASIDKSYIQLLISGIRFDSIHTFDDGTANICKTSALYRPETLKKKIGLFFFGNRYTRNKIIRLSSLHYTAYPTYENITKNIKEVNLFCDCKIGQGDSESTNVFIGGVYHELSSSKNELVDRINKFFDKPFYYIPHPRDQSTQFDNSVFVDGVEVAERKVIKLLRKHKSLTLYGFNSTAQLNLNNIELIENICFKADLIDGCDAAKLNIFKEVKL